jgi:hypothetical protein
MDKAKRRGFSMRIPFGIPITTQKAPPFGERLSETG